LDNPRPGRERPRGSDEPPLPDARRPRRGRGGGVSRYLISGGRVVDPAGETDAVMDVLVDGGAIAEIGAGIAAPDAEPIDADGLMHEGQFSAELGLRGIPAEAEELMAARDITLCRLTGCRLHLLHISTKGTVDLVRRAKQEGLPVTAEATPHHFSLTDASL